MLVRPRADDGRRVNSGGFWNVFPCVFSVSVRPIGLGVCTWERRMELCMDTVVSCLVHRDDQTCLQTLSHLHWRLDTSCCFVKGDPDSFPSATSLKVLNSHHLHQPYKNTLYLYLFADSNSRFTRSRKSRHHSRTKVDIFFSFRNDIQWIKRKNVLSASYKTFQTFPVGTQNPKQWVAHFFERVCESFGTFQTLQYTWERPQIQQFWTRNSLLCGITSLFWRTGWQSLVLSRVTGRSCQRFAGEFYPVWMSCTHWSSTAN